ncbi:MAG TPA: hypothetical protein VFU40_09295 [Gemmatimonadales bacterium]|nr:hypothetical protein [Gemmatimonadales bacterium]
MRHLLILAAAASLAMGCHQRTEDEVGAAPDRGDTTAVAADTAQAMPADTTMGQMPPADTGYVTEDTTMTPTGEDTVGAQGEVQTGDTTGAWTDTTGAAPADCAAPAQ